MKQNPTTKIKCAFSNKIHKLLEQNMDVPANKRWMKKKVLSDKEKLALFEQIEQLHKESSTELRNYFSKKRSKKILAKEREERGYKPKKKTTKQEYEALKQAS